MQTLRKYKVKFKGKIFFCVTITQLGIMCNRKKSAMHRLEERYILQRPILRLRGKRIYTIKLATRISEILSEVKQGIRITDEQRRQIAIAFQQEKLDLYLREGMTEQEALNT